MSSSPYNASITLANFSHRRFLLILSVGVARPDSAVNSSVVKYAFRICSIPVSPLAAPNFLRSVTKCARKDGFDKRVDVGSGRSDRIYKK